MANPETRAKGIYTARSGQLIACAVALACLFYAPSLCKGRDALWRSPRPTREEALSLLKAVCPHSIHTDEKEQGSFLGCCACPEFTTDGSPDSVVAIKESFNLHSVVRGSFTVPAIEEAVGSFVGCEPHVSNFGGSVLLRKFAGGWKFVSYEQAVITSDCSAYRLRSGRDILLCRGESRHFNMSSTGIFTYDFALHEGQRYEGVLLILDTRFDCGASAVWGSIENAKLRDLNDDGMADLTLSVRAARADFPGNRGSCAPDTDSIPTDEYRLDFLFEEKDNTFVAAPQSRELKKSLDALFEAGLSDLQQRWKSRQ